MTLQELSPTDQLEFQKVFLSNPRAIQLDKDVTQFRKQGKFVQSLKAAQQLNALKESLFQEWIRTLNREAERVDLNKLDIPDEIKEMMNSLYVTVFMACDIIESSVLDMNDTLKKVDNSLCVDMFDGMLKLSKDAKDKLARFQRNTGYLNDTFWGDRCDEMYRMMQNKAKKLIRHNKDKDEE